MILPMSDFITEILHVILLGPPVTSLFVARNFAVGVNTSTRVRMGMNLYTKKIRLI